MLRGLALIFSLSLIAPVFAITPLDTSSEIIISVRDQKLMLVGTPRITDSAIVFSGSVQSR